MILPSQIIEQTATTPDELEQSPSGMMILFMSSEVFSEVGNTGTQESNLYL